MPIKGTVGVRCPHCRAGYDASLVQSLNAKEDDALVDQLVSGELNVLTCECGRRTLLEATLLFVDPERQFYCQACPGGEAAMAAGARAFETISPNTTRRLVPSHNALVEKVLILRAGLDDAIVEVLKVLLLASRGDDLNRVLLFTKVDRDANVIVWQLPDQDRTITSPFEGYAKLAGSKPPSPGDEMRVDRVWAIEAARVLRESAN